MGKFKAGDRVRVIDASGAPRDYDFGEVGKVDLTYSDNLVRLEGKTAGMFDYRFELVEDKWQPKVGDRVRFVRDSTAGGARYGAEGEMATVVSSAREIPDGRYALDVKLDNDRIGFSPAAYLDDLEPLPVATEAQPAPLTIEAGKFYKTRDGRKVGPYEHSFSDIWIAGNGNHSTARFENGRISKYHESSDDLIAEWVDETAVAVAAGNDNAAPAKFKVGDVVEVVKAGESHQEKYVGTKFTIDSDEGDYDGQQSWSGRDHGSPYRWKESQLKLFPVTTSYAIVALIEDGQPKPATKPKIHADQASAISEAERLALAHPGQEFGVFVLADSKIADEVITKTAVLRAA